MFGLHFARRLVFAIGVIGCAFLARGAVAAEPLTLERIFGKKPILTPLPDPVWVGDSRGISLVHDVTPRDGSARKAFVIRDVPSGKERVLAWLDDIPVPGDLKAAGQDKFSIDAPSWTNDGSRAAFVFGGDVFMIDRHGKVERVTDTDGEEQDPTFSRDGHWLVLGYWIDTKSNDLWLVNFDQYRRTGRVDRTVVPCRGHHDHLHLRIRAPHRADGLEQLPVGNA